MGFTRTLDLLFYWIVVALSAAAPQHIDIRVPSKVNSALANVHLWYRQPISAEHTFTYGPCDGTSTDEAVFHSSGSNQTESGSHRFVWMIPDNATTGGCISAWKDNSNELLGRSAPITFTESHPNVKRDDTSIPMTNASGIDAEGPWFDGVELLKNKEIGAVDVKAAKSKSKSYSPS
jgi:hypothetical protein